MEKKYIGYIKYSGDSVENGIMDARKSAQALLGFDEAIKYFASKEEPSLLNKNYDLPVKIQKGSWEMLLPILENLLTPEGVFGVYVASSMNQAAKEGLFETGISKDIEKIFKSAFVTLQWIIKIAKHAGSFTKNLKVKYNLENGTVNVLNEKGENLTITQDQYKIYKECPESILNKLVSNVENDRVLKVGIFIEEGINEVEILKKDKHIFYIERTDENEMSYPEFQQDDIVELEGIITKVNETTNSLGFKYKNHILKILPMNRNVAEYKSQFIASDNSHVFRAVKIAGIINRKGKDGEVLKKPQVIFSTLITINEENGNNTLI